MLVFQGMSTSESESDGNQGGGGGGGSGRVQSFAIVVNTLLAVAGFVVGLRAKQTGDATDATSEHSYQTIVDRLQELEKTSDQQTDATEKIWEAMSRVELQASARPARVPSGHVVAAAVPPPAGRNPPAAPTPTPAPAAAPAPAPAGPPTPPGTGPQPASGQSVATELGRFPLRKVMLKPLPPYRELRRSQ